MPFVQLPQTPEGMPLPPLKSFLTDPGRRLKAIQDLQTGEKDILLNSYPKSGKTPHTQVPADRPWRI